MFGRIRKAVGNLKSSTSGNTTLLVALGMPALIGGAGMAVDTAQWYLWKRELQFAADQAALAGAWARTSSDTEALFQERALQEIDANLSVTSDIIGTPSVSIADFGVGTDNSVIVSVSARKSLPFSSFLTGEATTVVATAQATFTELEDFSACILAVNKTDDSSIIVQGNVTMSQNCGIAALSDASESISRNGNASDLGGGDLTSRGGIDDDFNDIDGININEYISNLFDPYENLVAPIDATPKTYDCAAVAAEYPYEQSAWTTTNFRKQQFSSSTNTAPTAASVWVDLAEAPYPYSENGTPSVTGLTSLPAGTSVNKTYTTPGVWTTNSQNGPTTTQSQTKVKNKTVTTTTYTWTRIQQKVDSNTSYDKTKSNGNAAKIATLQPGTYSSISVACDTVFAGGVYVINGGQFKVNGNDSVTSGSGIMIVLTNGATIDINGGANVSLRPMTKAELDTAIATGDDMTAGSSTDLLAGMLVMEVKRTNLTALNSSKINGNAGFTVNGTIYLPQTELDLSGNAQVSSDCLMIAASKIKFSGNMYFANMCPDESTQTAGIQIGSGSAGVRLVR